MSLWREPGRQSFSSCSELEGPGCAWIVLSPSIGLQILESFETSNGVVVKCDGLPDFDGLGAKPTLSPPRLRMVASCTSHSWCWRTCKRDEKRQWNCETFTRWKWSHGKGRSRLWNKEDLVSGIYLVAASSIFFSRKYPKMYRTMVWQGNSHVTACQSPQHNY